MVPLCWGAKAHGIGSSGAVELDLLDSDIPVHAPKRIHPTLNPYILRECCVSKNRIVVSMCFPKHFVWRSASLSFDASPEVRCWYAWGVTEDFLSPWLRSWQVAHAFESDVQAYLGCTGSAMILPGSLAPCGETTSFI